MLYVKSLTPYGRVHLKFAFHIFVVYPFYDSKYQDVPQKVSKGMTAYLDPRYMNRTFAEAKLMEIIPQCWIYNAQQRIDIITLVEYLRNAVRENRAREHLLHQFGKVAVLPVLNK